MEIDNQEQDYNFDSPENSIQNMKYFEAYKSFSQTLKNRIADSKYTILNKDPNYDFLYLLSNPLLVLNPLTYEIIQKIRYSDKVKLEDLQKVINFYNNGVNYFLIYNTNSIFIPAPSSEKKVNLDFTIEQRLTFLRENEQIVKIYYIPNEFNLPYFTVVSSISKIYFLRLKFDNSMQDFDFTYEELNEKINFLRKFMSNFVPSLETNKIFILNPFSYTKYQRNNKKNNILFLFNENYLKKIDFNVTTKGIEPELNFQINIINLIIDKLRVHNRNATINARNVSIESADCVHDKLRKLNKIYFIVKYESSLTEGRTSFVSGFFTHYYLFQMTVHHETNELKINMMFSFSDTHEGERLQLTNTSQIILNKYREEGYLLFSQPKCSFIYYFYQDDFENLSYKILDFDIRGVNILNSIDKFSIDVFSMDENGVKYLYFAEKRINVLDKTNIFVSNAIYPNTSNELNEGQRTFNKIFPSQDYNIFKAESGENLEMIIHSALSYFYERACSYGGYNPALGKLDYEILNFNKKLKKFDYDQISQTVVKLLGNIADDESTNVDIINKESIKAELVIIEYLLQKEKKLECLYDFLTQYQILEKFDPNKTIFLTFLQLREKLTSAIRLREYENSIIDRSGGLDINIPPEKMNYFYQTASAFFTKVYLYLKNAYSRIEQEKPFTKQLVYSKISQIDVYLDNLSLTYKNYVDDLRISKDDKIIFTHIMIALFNRIFSSIKIVQEKYFSENNINFDINTYSESTFDISIFKDNLYYLWLLREDYLEFFKFIFYKFLEFYSFLKTLYKLDQLNNELILYTDNILYFFDFYFKINQSSENKKIYFELRKELLGKLINIDAERTLKLAKKYSDFYTFTLICYQNQWTGTLLEYMKERKKNRKEILYFLKLYLLLESQNLRRDKKYFTNFSFFDNFIEFRDEMQETVEKYPKLNFLYDIYLKSRESGEISERRFQIEELTRSIVDLKNLHIFLKLAKIVNSLNKFNIEELAHLNMENQMQTQQFLVENENNAKEINFYLLVNYLVNSFQMINSVDTRDIFFSFEQFIKQFIQINNSENIDVYIKFKLAIQLVLLAMEINYKFPNSQEMFNSLLSLIYNQAFQEDSKIFNEYLNEKFNTNSIDSLSDEQRRQVNSKSIMSYLMGNFPEGREYVRSIVYSQEAIEAHDKVEFIHFLKTLYNQH